MTQPSQRPPTAYDEVVYPSAVYAQTHPDRLATLATLYGMKPAPVERCRVLELGCGDGSNLLAMAYALPGSEFVGLDLAQRPIQKGHATVEALGLKNLRLRALDVLAFPPNLGPFDFIIAHGLYSWVPAEVRDQILAICGERLTPSGVAYVSYNAYPGNHQRDLARRMMQYHARHFPNPQRQIRQARGLLKFLVESKAEPDVYRMILKQEFERVTKYTDAAFFHDDLSPINHPVYFHEFADHAARHGLQYLGEAEALDMQPREYPPHVEATLSELDSGDVIAREQYADFLRCRAFRQTLLCRREHPLDRTWKPEHMQGLFIAGEIRPALPTPDCGSNMPERFLGPKGAEIETSRPIVKAAFLRLGAVWPRWLHFHALLESISPTHPGRATAPSAGSGEKDAEELAAALLQAYAMDFVELHAHKPAFVTEVSERPVASALARQQLREGDFVSTMRHQVFKVEGRLGRQLVLLLDGTRDRATLLRDLGESLKSRAGEERGAVLAGDETGEAPGRLTQELESSLASLARAAILVA